MPDREKVIKGLEYCEEYFNCCDKCQYWDGGTHCTADLAHDALALLKEQQEKIDRLLEESASNAEMAEGMKELLKEQEKLINELLELGYPHNFQHEAPWVVDYLYSLTEIIKKAFKAKESR